MGTLMLGYLALVLALMPLIGAWLLIRRTSDTMDRGLGLLVFVACAGWWCSPLGQALVDWMIA
jgi:hypothetical protein